MSVGRRSSAAAAAAAAVTHLSGELNVVSPFIHSPTIFPVIYVCARPLAGTSRNVCKQDDLMSEFQVELAA